jgi:hypothetical protein
MTLKGESLEDSANMPDPDVIAADITEVAVNDVVEYQRKRLAARLSSRTVNYEMGCLHEILRQFGLWGPMADRVRALFRAPQRGPRPLACR